ncbi:hypothetical protein C2E23DRAFT_853487 [Lenzites betulinus]|nr:hypothetical protein C2E23DRAFT_853487 [Lenzites betulinus]
MADSIPIPLAIALASRSVAVRTSPTRPPPPVQALSDKAQQRLIRQAVAKAELEAEERDALRITAEEMCILQESVRSVKTEFADLDGLSWDTPEAREELAQWPCLPPSLRLCLRLPAPPLSLSFAHVSASTPDLTPMPSPVDEEDDEHTITRPLSMDSRRSSAATIVPDRDDARTPLPSDADADGQENVRPALPKSLSAPHLARPANPLADATNAHIRAPLPPSRIPVRSKSLSAVPSVVHAPTRHASLSTRPWGPRTIHLPRLGRPPASGANTNGRRIRLTGLSASPARLHPAPASSSARPDAHEQPDERLASPSRPHRSKLRIVSAPSPGAGGRGRGFPDPLVRVRGVGVCRVVASGSATAAGASSARGRAGSAGEQEGARGAKRGRATPDAVEDRDSPSPSPSPSRLRAASGSSSGASRMRPVPAGGVPMQRT